MKFKIRIHFLVCFFLVGNKISSQQLLVLSSVDSLPVPFTALEIKCDYSKIVLVSDENGVFKIDSLLIDSVSYKITIHCIGFQKLESTISGKQLNRLSRIYLPRGKTDLEEVVVTAQYQAVSVEKSVQKVTVISEEKIRMMGAVNLKDVLTNQMNVRLQQDNILGAAMSLQGISGENVKILMDGVPMIGRLNGNIDLTQINLNNVERIELIEGPLSVQYGTNALAGTINIITKKNTGKKYRGGVSTYYESIGTYNLTGDVGFSKSKHSVQASGGRNYFDGWNSSDKPFLVAKPQVADSGRYKQWKPKEQYFGTMGYQYETRKLGLGLQSSLFSEKIINRGYPRAPYAETAFDDYYFTKRLDNNLSLRVKLGTNWAVNSLSAYNYYNRIKKTVYKDLTTLDEILSPNSSDHDTSTFDLIMSRASFINGTPAGRVKYEIGYDLNYESARGKRLENELQYIGDYAVFATAEFKPVSNIVVKPGIRYAYNTAYESPLIPSLNVKWTVGQPHVFRASYARGFRAPSIKELYFLFVDINHNIVGSKELKAEYSDNYSLSYFFKKNYQKFVFKTEVNCFYNQISDLITLAQTAPTEYSYINIGEFKTVGLQWTNTFSFDKSSFQAGMNYTGRTNNAGESETVPGFNFSPEVLLNFTYSIPRNIGNVALFFKYNGRVAGYAIVRDEVTQTFISPYSILDCTFGRLFFKGQLRLTCGVKNILDVQNINSVTSGGTHSSSSTTVPLSTGRNFFIGLNFNINQK